MAKKQVVLVEDNESIRELIEYMLTDEGLEVVSFSSVGNFCNSAMDVSPDLYILDIMLPDGSGIDICKALKSKPTTQDTPIIMMSAHVNNLDCNCDAADFIAKPFDIDYFISRINQQICG